MPPPVPSSSFSVQIFQRSPGVRPMIPARSPNAAAISSPHGPAIGKSNCTSVGTAFLQSGSDQVEHLVPPALHQALVEGLEVEAKEWLGVRGANVEVPVVEVDRDTVEMGDAPTDGGVALLDLPELGVDVRDRRFDLAAQEVPLAVRREQLRQLSPFGREELEHDEERDEPGVRPREVAEVVVRGHLTGEQRVTLAHAILEECVADPVDEGG